MFYSHALASRSRDVYRLKRSEDLVEKNYISTYMCHKRFIQTGKCSFFSQNNCLSKCQWRIAQVKLFFFQVKVLWHGMHGKVACELCTV